MTWTDIDLYRVNQLSTADTMDTLRENIEYLHAPNMAYYKHPGMGSDYTNTGTLGDDIDSTNFKLSLTTYGRSSMVLACFYCVIAVNAGSVRLNIVKTNTTSHTGVNLYNNYIAESAATSRRGISWIQRFPNLPAGTHEFRAIWGVNGGTGTIYVEHRPYMAVIEK